MGWTYVNGDEHKNEDKKQNYNSLLYIETLSAVAAQANMIMLGSSIANGKLENSLIAGALMLVTSASAIFNITNYHRYKKLK